jgi:hypothetical protein
MLYMRRPLMMLYIVISGQPIRCVSMCTCLWHSYAHTSDTHNKYVARGSSTKLLRRPRSSGAPAYSQSDETRAMLKI